MLSLVKWCFNVIIQKRTSVLKKKLAFLATLQEVWVYTINAELCEAFTFLMENLHVQFEGIAYNQQIVCTPMGTNCDPLMNSGFVFIIWKRGILGLIFKDLNSMTL